MSAEIQLVADFDQLYTNLTEAIQEHEILSVNNLAPIIMKAMVLVEKVSAKTKEKGDVKKQLVIRLVERLIQDLAPEAQREQILSVFHSVGPSVIDALVSADHTQFLKKVHSWTKRVCKCK